MAAFTFEKRSTNNKHQQDRYSITVWFRTNALENDEMKKASEDQAWPDFRSTGSCCFFCFRLQRPNSDMISETWNVKGNYQFRGTIISKVTLWHAALELIRSCSHREDDKTNQRCLRIFEDETYRTKRQKR